MCVCIYIKLNVEPNIQKFLKFKLKYLGALPKPIHSPERYV